jgi:uncharacterized protein (DUF1786 family)
MILTMDIGMGTQDILLYDPSRKLQNCPKLILPSPTIIKSREISQATEQSMPVYLKGYIMGGGAVTMAVKNHLKAGLDVYAEKQAAYTFSDDLDKVLRWGVKFEEPDKPVKEVVLKDVDESIIREILERIYEPWPDIALIAVQDHGFSPDVSNRKFRFAKFKEILKKNSRLSAFLFSKNTLPDYFSRMKSLYEYLSGEIYVMDTVFSSMIGAWLSVDTFPALIVNFGNGHTVGGVIGEDMEVYSLFEHHTSIIRNRDVGDFFARFIAGKLTNRDVFEDGGHGCAVFEVVEPKEIVVTGPNSDIYFSQGYHGTLANPAGDVMVVGNLGLIEAFLQKKGESLSKAL